jgi:hypothetical protein
VEADEFFASTKSASSANGAANASPLPTFQPSIARMNRERTSSDLDFMFSRSVEDPDGNVWEVM